MKRRIFLSIIFGLLLIYKTGYAETGTVSSNLDVHMPSLDYETSLGTQNIWANFEYLGVNLEGRHIWGLKGFGVNPAIKPQESKVPWIGATMLESSAWQAKIKIECLEKGKPCGTIDFQSLNCGGKLTYLGKKSNKYVFSEQLEYGNCVQDCDIHIESDGSSYREFCSGGDTGGGDLFF